MTIARGIASGMAYLHSRDVLHRDLKSANVLLGVHATGFCPKLVDFGTATEGGTNRPRRPNRGNLTAETGTYRWMAPEVINHEHYSRPADVFSFAMVFYELLTHQVPFAHLTPVRAASAIAIERTRPALPEGTPQAVAQLMGHCWDGEPSRRPTFDALNGLLSALAERLTGAELAWLSQVRLSIP